MSEVHEPTPHTALKGETAGEGGHEEGFAHAVGSGQKESLFRRRLTPRPFSNGLDGPSEGGRRLVIELKGLKRCLDIEGGDHCGIEQGTSLLESVAVAGRVFPPAAARARACRFSLQDAPLSQHHELGLVFGSGGGDSN
jgi:hypothetical protein